MMSIYQRFGVATVINACGTVTRLSGGRMHPDVAAAMVEASRECVDMVALQAGASRVIASVTGGQAGIVTSGASAGVLLGAAACLAGLDPARMNRLPLVADGRNAFIVVRSQRNMYDRAIAVAGGRIVEVGIPDRYSGPGVRDASAFEIAAAITPDTAAIYYLAHPRSLPPLAEVAAVAHEHGVPLLVDAAAQLPPAANLRRFLEQGADLVAFSGGKAIGGPQASGILCGRADLVASALLQMLDLDVFPDMWRAPEEFAVAASAARTAAARHRPFLQGGKGGDHRSARRTGALRRRRCGCANQHAGDAPSRKLPQPRVPCVALACASSTVRCRCSS